MFIQGNLQAVFDALFMVGAIDPVLKADWKVIMKEMAKQPKKVKQIMSEVNACRGEESLLLEKFRQLDTTSLKFVAMEVAREFVEFQDRSELH